MLWGKAGCSLLRWHGSSITEFCMLPTTQFHRHHPDSKQLQINFKLAVRAEWTSNCITMLWGRVGFSLLRWHGSSNIKFRILPTWQFHPYQPDSKQSQINFKLAVRTEWTSNCSTTLWGRAGFSLLRWHAWQPNYRISYFTDYTISSPPPR